MAAKRRGFSDRYCDGGGAGQQGRDHRPEPIAKVLRPTGKKWERNGIEEWRDMGRDDQGGGVTRTRMKKIEV